MGDCGATTVYWRLSTMDRRCDVSASVSAVVAGSVYIRRGEHPMANPEHVAILKKGVKKWNQWRKENPNTKPDLSEIQFTSLKLTKCIYGDESYIDLEGIDFSATNLSSARIW